MLKLLFFILPAAVGAIIRIRRMSEFYAWLLSSSVIPILLLIDNVLTQYKSGGASMLTIALAVGSFYGAISGGFGVVIASLYLKNMRHD